jgi:hypothetical protein
MSRRPGPWLIEPLHRELIPKPGGGSRSLITLEPADERAFARAVAGAAPAIRSAQRPASYADRVAGWDAQRGFTLEPWERARRRWRRAALIHGEDARFAVVTDVRDCFASISTDAVVERLLALGAGATSLATIGSWLRAFHDSGVDGLPVGPAASALLADAVLSAGDDAIHRTGAAHVRWVDDVAIFAHDRRTRTVALEALRRAWGGLGLELHDGKTQLVDDPLVVGRQLSRGSNSPGRSSSLR